MGEFPKCEPAGHMRVGFEEPSTIYLSRCCMRDNEILDKMDINDFLQIDPYEWCLKNFKKNPENHNFKCDLYSLPCNYEFDEKLTTIDVGISHACNAKCPFCFMGKTHKDSSVMKKAYFHTISSLKGHNLAIGFSDRGEPFIYKKEIFEFLSSLKKDDFIRFDFLTNAQLIDKSDIDILLSLKNPVNILVSLDAFSSETYKKVRTNDCFEKVIENILYLKEKSILRGVNTVIYEDNINEVLNIKNFMKEHEIPWSYVVLNGFKVSEEFLIQVNE